MSKTDSYYYPVMYMTGKSAKSTKSHEGAGVHSSSKSPSTSKSVKSPKSVRMMGGKGKGKGKGAIYRKLGKVKGI